MTNEQHGKKQKGYDDATCDRDRDEKLSGDSWYEEGFMEGKLKKVEWAMEELREAIAIARKG